MNKHECTRCGRIKCDLSYDRRYMDVICVLCGQELDERDERIEQKIKADPKNLIGGDKA